MLSSMLKVESIIAADGILNMVLLWNAWHLDVCELFETYICFSFSYFNGLTAGNETKMPIRVYQTYAYVNLLKNFPAFKLQ